MEIKMMKNILDSNQQKARQVRKRLDENRILMLNLIGSPGAGKTLLLEKTIEALKNKYSMGVIESDVETDRDAKRLQRLDIPIVMIGSEGACHIESIIADKALNEFDLPSLDLLFVENVGNLVCPAEFDLGEHCKVAVSSTTEGEDKPAKYPLLFRESSICLLNKIDLLPYIRFDKNVYKNDLFTINPNIDFFEISCEKPESLDPWIQWIEDKYSSLFSSDYVMNQEKNVNGG